MATWYERTRELTLSMVGFMSQTNAPGEKAFIPFFYEKMAAMPYFQKNPRHLRRAPTLNDPFEREVVFALVKGRGPRTVILTGHYDVVGIENYGELAEWAGNPEELLPRLIDLLETEAARGDGLPPGDRLALEDLLSGAFLPGRGMLDMKSGLAAGWAVLERFSQLPDDQRAGCLLYIAVPDEEIASYGARSAAALLPALTTEWGLDLAAAINLDASDDHGDGSQGRAAYLGSVGKLLPAVYLVGRETHASSPFSGVNTTLLAAELTRRIECEPGLIDHGDGEFTPPPVCLKQGDTKSGYDVTTPTASWCYYNWLTLRRPAEGVLEKVAELARAALQAAQESLSSAALRYAETTGTPVTLPDRAPQVYHFAEVKAIAVRRGGKAFAESFEALQRRLAGDARLDTPSVSLALTEAAWAASGLTGPAAVIGFAALYYPPVSLGSDEKAARLREAIRIAAGEACTSKGISFALRPFFPGISDISFLGSRAPAEEIAVVADNSPAWQGRTSFDAGAIERLGLPVVNIGSWGRDYHQRIERVHASYAFETLPQILWRVCELVLEG